MILNKFPNISRVIHDKENTPVLLLTLIVLIALLIVSVDVSRNYKKFSDLSQKKTVLEKEKEGWTKVLIKYPDYRGGYLSLAIIEYKLGNRDKSRQYLNKALNLDPNFDEGRAFKEFLDLD